MTMTADDANREGVEEPFIRICVGQTESQAFNSREKTFLFCRCIHFKSTNFDLMHQRHGKLKENRAELFLSLSRMT